VRFDHDDKRMTGTRATGETYEPSFFQLNFDRQGQPQVQRSIAFRDAPIKPHPDADMFTHQQDAAFTDKPRFVEGVEETLTETAVHTGIDGKLSSSPPSEPVFLTPKYVRAGDINADGKLDIVDLHWLLTTMSDPQALSDPMNLIPYVSDVDQDGLRFNGVTSEVTGTPHLTQTDVAILSLDIRAQGQQ